MPAPRRQCTHHEWLATDILNLSAWRLKSAVNAPAPILSTPKFLSRDNSRLNIDTMKAHVRTTSVQVLRHRS